MAYRLPAGSGVCSRSSAVLVVIIGFDDEIGLVRVVVVFVRLAPGPERNRFATSRAAAAATVTFATAFAAAAARVSEIVVLSTKETATEGQQAADAAVRIRIVRANVPLTSAAKTWRKVQVSSSASSGMTLCVSIAQATHQPSQIPVRSSSSQLQCPHRLTPSSRSRTTCASRLRRSLELSVPPSPGNKPPHVLSFSSSRFGSISPSPRASSSSPFLSTLRINLTGEADLGLVPCSLTLARDKVESTSSSAKIRWGARIAHEARHCGQTRFWIRCSPEGARTGNGIGAGPAAREVAAAVVLVAAAVSAVARDAVGGAGGGGARDGARTSELGPATSDVPIDAVSADSTGRRLSKRASRARRSASALSSASSSAETAGGASSGGIRPPAAPVVVPAALAAEVEGPERSPHKSASTRRLCAISSADSLGARTAAAAEVDAFATVDRISRARE